MDDTPPDLPADDPEEKRRRADLEEFEQLAGAMKTSAAVMESQVNHAVGAVTTLTKLLEEVRTTADKAAGDVEALQFAAQRRSYGVPRIEEATQTSIIPPAVTSSIHTIEHTVRKRQTGKVEDRWTKLALAALVLLAAVFNYLAPHH